MSDIEKHRKTSENYLNMQVIFPEHHFKVLCRQQIVEMYFKIECASNRIL